MTSKSSPGRADFVSSSGCGRQVGKARAPAVSCWQSGAGAAPCCGETPTTDSAIAALVRTSLVMSSRQHQTSLTVLPRCGDMGSMGT